MKVEWYKCRPVMGPAMSELVRYEGEIVGAVTGFWGTYFIIKLASGKFEKCRIEDVSEVNP